VTSIENQLEAFDVFEKSKNFRRLTDGLLNPLGKQRVGWLSQSDLSTGRKRGMTAICGSFNSHFFVVSQQSVLQCQKCEAYDISIIAVLIDGLSGELPKCGSNTAY